MWWGLHILATHIWCPSYISQVVAGEKLYLKWSEVKVCSVRHFKGLHTINLLEFGTNEWNLESYLPEYEYRKLPSRPWLCNVLNTFLGDKFKMFIQEKMKERVRHVVNKKKLNVMALPQFIDIFQKSNRISVQKGRSHYLIKACEKRKWKTLRKMTLSFWDKLLEKRMNSIQLLLK